MPSPVARSSPNTLVEASGPLEGAVLSLGSRIPQGKGQEGSDAYYWAKGCAQLSPKVTVDSPVIDGLPSPEELQAFFSTPVEWVYLAGHWFGALANACYDSDEAHYHQPRLVFFDEGSVEAQYFDEPYRTGRPTNSYTFVKGDGFRLHEQCKVLVFGGCSVITHKWVPILRKLFGTQTLILGPSKTTSIESMNMVFGNVVKGPKGLFQRISNPLDLADVRDSWLDAAKAWFYPPPEGEASHDHMVDRFKAVDPDGTLHWIAATTGERVTIPGKYA